MGSGMEVGLKTDIVHTIHGKDHGILFLDLFDEGILGLPQKGIQFLDFFLMCLDFPVFFTL